MLHYISLNELAADEFIPCFERAFVDYVKTSFFETFHIETEEIIFHFYTPFTHLTRFALGFNNCKYHIVFIY